MPIRASAWWCVATPCWQPNGHASVEELLRATERLLDPIVAATEREKRPLTGICESLSRFG